MPIAGSDERGRFPVIWDVESALRSALRGNEGPISDPPLLEPTVVLLLEVATLVLLGRLELLLLLALALLAMPMPMLPLPLPPPLPL